MKEIIKARTVAPHFFSAEKRNVKARILSIAFAVPIDYLALIGCCLAAFALICFFLLMIKPLVFLRADILMWEETDFVGNMIKLNIGAPLYTAPEDGNSMIYNPAAFLVTYAIAWIFGQTKSVVGLRLIQIGFVVCASLLATVCSRKIYRLAFPERAMRYSATWAVFSFFALFLAATAPDSNKFVYVLHVDALSLLVSVVCFWVILRYAENDSLKNLVLMSLFPALGFLTKQFLISWILVMFVFLLIYQPKNYKRLGLFVLLACGFITLAYGACYLTWGDNYIFWTSEVMGARKSIVLSPDSPSISLVRSFDHLVRVWTEIFVGIVGIWLLLRRGIKCRQRLTAALAGAWLTLIAGETLSSGAGWNVLYHFGPGVLIGAIFMFAALPSIWNEEEAKNENETSLLFRWSRVFVMCAAVVAVFLAWGVVPTGDKNQSRYLRGIQTSADIDRYVADIEGEFENLPDEKVLLGVGSWIYLRDNVLQKDRAISLADQPMGGIYKNFDVTVNRIRSKTYQKILVQDFHSPFFLYDWNDWARPSGFRQALSENYIEIRTIEPPQGNALLPSQILNAGAVSVFIPRE